MTTKKSYNRAVRQLGWNDGYVAGQIDMVCMIHTLGGTSADLRKAVRLIESIDDAIDYLTGQDLNSTEAKVLAILKEARSDQYAFYQSLEDDGTL